MKLRLTHASPIYVERPCEYGEGSCGEPAVQIASGTYDPETRQAIEGTIEGYVEGRAEAATPLIDRVPVTIAVAPLAFALCARHRIPWEGEPLDDFRAARAAAMKPAGDAAS